MNQQITDEEYQMTTNINGLNVTITVTQTDQSNNQPNMNMQINSQQMNEVPNIQSLIINNQNVLIQNNNKLENQPNNFFSNPRRKVIKIISEIKQEYVKGETLREQIKRQDNEQNIQNLIANQEQTLNFLKINSNEQQNKISPLMKRPKIKILDEAPLKLIKRPKIKILGETPLKPKKINQFQTRTLKISQSLVNNAQSSHQDFKKKTQLNPINFERSLVNYEQGILRVQKKKLIPKNLINYIEQQVQTQMNKNRIRNKTFE